MASSLSAALSRIKQDLNQHLPPASIESACRAAGHRWRERKLGPVRTVHLFLLQVLHANAAITALRHLAKLPFSASAYCQARARLPLAVLQQLLLLTGTGGGGGESRPRTLLVDASGTMTPDTPALRRAFGCPRGHGRDGSFPVPKVLGLFDAATGLIVQAMAFALFVHEQSKVWMLHPLLRAGDVLVGDRAFCSYAQLALLAGRGVAAVFRVHQSTIVSFRPHRKSYDRRRGPRSRYAQRGRPRSRFVRRLGRHDQVVRWIKPRWRDGARSWLSRAQWDALPEELPLREVRYAIPAAAVRGRRTRGAVTVVTTLLDATAYPAEAIAELYGLRWQVETHWRELKTTMGMQRLKCKSAAGVLKELAAYLLAYNLVRAVMCRAAARQGTTPDRVSFADALRWLLSAAPGEALLCDLVINPWRPGRHEPRAIKRPWDSYPRLRGDRHNAYHRERSAA
jgi:hypothetical protein